MRKKVLLASVLAFPFVLFTGLACLLYLPQVQKWAVGKVTVFASEQTGMDIRIGYVRMRFPLDLELRDVYAKDNLSLTAKANRLVASLDVRRLLESEIGVHEIHLDGADLTYTLPDSTVNDTTELKTLQWTLSLKEISVYDTRLRLIMPADSSEVFTYLSSMNLRDGRLDLARQRYLASEISAKFDTLRYVRNFADTLALRETLSVQLLHFCFDVPKNDIATNLLLRSPHSCLSGEAKIQLTAFSDTPNGMCSANLSAELGMDDVRAYLKGRLPKEIEQSLPTSNMSVQLVVSGNMDDWNVKRMQIDWSEIAACEISGCVKNLLSHNDISVQAECNIRTGRHTFLNSVTDPSMFPLQNLHLHTESKLQGTHYQANIALNKEGGKGLSVKGDVQGNGFDWQSPSTNFDGNLHLRKLAYDHWTLDELKMQAHFHQQHGLVEICCNDSLIRFSACASGEMGKELKNAILDLDVEQMNLYRLGITKDTLGASMSLHMNGTSNLKDRHHIEASLENLQLTAKDTVLHPADLHLRTTLLPDTSFVWFNAGDLQLGMSAYESLDSLWAKSHHSIQVLQRQADKFHLRQDSLKEFLPNLNVTLQSGTQNPLNNLLRHFTSTAYEHFDFNLSTSPYLGFNGSGYINALTTGALKIDTVHLNLMQDSTGIHLKSHIRNEPVNKSDAFDAWIKAGLTESGAQLRLIFEDDKKERGVDLGANVDYRKDGLRIRLQPLHPVLAYRTFTVNEDNFIQLCSDGRLMADLNLLADDGTGLKLYSIENSEAKQDISLNVTHFNLGELSRAIPLMPDMQGLLQGDAHYIQSDSTLYVSSDMEIDRMKLKGAALGHIGLNLVYLPNSDGSHFVDALLTQDGDKILAMSGKYTPDQGDGLLSGTARLTRLPMSLANGFFPEDACRLEGYASGEMDVSGSPSHPLISGQFRTDALNLYSDLYNIHLQIPNDTILVEDNQVTLSGIQAFTAGKNPLTVDGTIDFRETSHIRLDIGVKASDYELINSRRKRESIAFGKVYVNINTRISGTLDDIHVRGRLDVLGRTDVSYILRDSPVTVKDRLSDLVTFTDFSDTLTVEQDSIVHPQHIDARLHLSIEQSAQIHCLLSEDGTDYVKLEGGGDLTFTYDTENDMRLLGRYTILSGQMNYTLMSVVCKNFRIKNGSYVEFQGNLMNPKLQIAATERTTASVSSGGVPRNVAFDVGLSISQTLENMGLEFTLEAPEDLSVQNELAGMGSDERGRVAVTMLATGMYLTDNNKASGYSSTNALNNFLQSEINKIVGMAQNTIDVQFGMKHNTNATGSMQTDYSFSFAKRFWGNRISVVIGGKVSQGNDAVNNGQTLIDNVSLEYRLDQSGTRYVRLFYDKNYKSLLEGELTEMGTGILLRRKSDKLGDLFIFKRKKKEVTQ